MTSDSSDRRRRTADPASLYVVSGVVWRFVTVSYVVLFFLRATVEVRLDPLGLVLLGTAKEVMILVTEIPTGAVADLWSRRWSVILSFGICGVAIAAGGIVDSFPLLLVVSGGWAFGSTFRSGADTAWLSDEVGGGTRVDEILVRSSKFEAVGAGVGVAMSAVLAAFIGAGPALVVLGGVMIGWVVVLTLVMGETAFTRVAGSQLRRFVGLIRTAAGATRRVSALKILVVATVLSGFGSEAVDRLFIARIDEIGFPTDIDEALVVGGIVVLESIGAVVLISIVGRHMRGVKLAQTLTLVQVGVAAGVVVFAQVDVVVAALIALVLVGSIRRLSQTAIVGWTNHFTENEHRATVHSFVGQAHSLGEITGGVGLGLIATAYGLGASLTAAAAVYLLSGLVSSRGPAAWLRSA
jgi:DHA3 family tetracycline resistance protein-like MFS transporter